MLQVWFLCSSVVCVKEEYVTDSAEDIMTQLYLDNEKYKESGVGSSWYIVRLFR